MHRIYKNKLLYNFIAAWIIIIAAFLDAICVKMFLLPGNMISTGFTGLSILISVLLKNIGFSLSISLILILLNIPIIIICYRSIGKRFTLLSVLYIICSSIFIQLINFQPLFQDQLLLVLFGGVIGGFASVLALKVDASAGGTDFIALYFSNKYNKTVWEYVFIGNSIMIIILGFSQGWLYAGYSIIYQFVATRIISNFHTRYNRETLQIITTKPDEILKCFISLSVHGSTCSPCYGGYTKQSITLITTVVSSYERNNIIQNLKKIDKNVIINIFESKGFVGKFIQKNY